MTRRSTLVLSAVFIGVCAVVAGQRVYAQSNSGKLPPIGADQSNVPRLEVETTDFNVGTIENDEITVRPLKVFNKGKQPLEITTIRTSCGCTKAQMEDNGKVIPPGEMRYVMVSVDPARIPGFTSKKQLTIESNDPITPAVEVDVSATVKAEFSVIPDKIDLGNVERGEVRKMELVFRPENESGVQLLGVKPIRVAQGLDFAISEKPKETWASADIPEKLITVTLDTNSVPIGKYTGYFAVQTDAKRALVKEFQCRVEAVVTAFYAANKNALSFSMLAPGQEKELSFILSGHQPFELVDVNVTGDAFSVSAEPGPEGKSYTIKVLYTGSPVPGRKAEKVNFTVKQGDKILSDNIRVFGVVRKSPGEAVSQTSSDASVSTPAP